MVRHQADPPTSDYIREREEDGIRVDLNADEPAVEIAHPVGPNVVDTFTWAEDNAHTVERTRERNGDDEPVSAPARVTNLRFEEPVRPYDTEEPTRTLRIRSTDLAVPIVEEDGRRVWSHTLIDDPYRGQLVWPRDHEAGIRAALSSIAITEGFGGAYEFNALD